jgi:magnesium-protoporphyrin O-methyltransferase
VNAQLNGGVLLDIGGGIGAVTFELLAREVDSAVAVEASDAYLAVAREEAARRNHSEAVCLLHGDFVEVAPDVPVADVVTLDRVVCCYLEYRSLLRAAAARARRGLAMSYPRDRWFVRAGVRCENWLRRLRTDRFRTFVHPVSDMVRLLSEAGFELVDRRNTAAWASDIYVRRPALTAPIQSPDSSGRRHP